MKSNYIMELLSFYCISLLVLLSSGLKASAQDDNGGTTSSGTQLSFEAIATIVGLGGIVSGGISAIINLLVEDYLSKKKRKMRDALSRQSFYRDMIYQLERMLSSSRFQEATAPKDEVDETFEEIHKIMRENYLLLEEDIKDEWRKVSHNWRDYYPEQIRELYLRMTKLRDLLVKKYNGSRRRFAKETGRSVPTEIHPVNWPLEKLTQLKEDIVDYSEQKNANEDAKKSEDTAAR